MVQVGTWVHRACNSANPGLCLCSTVITSNDFFSKNMTDIFTT